MAIETYSDLLPHATDTQRVLLGKILRAISGTGGGGSSGVTFGNFGGVAPVFVPTGGVGFAIDTTNGGQWEFYNNAWH